MIKHFSILLFLLLPVFGFGQDKVLFTNGKETKGYVIYEDNYSVFIGIPSNEEDIYLKRKEKNQKKYEKTIAKAKKKNAKQKSISKIDSAYYKSQQENDNWINEVRAKKKIEAEKNLKKISLIEPLFAKKKDDIENKHNQSIDQINKKIETSEAEKSSDLKLKKEYLIIKKSKKIEQLNKLESKTIASIKYKSIATERKENVFSIIHADGKEEIIYSPDTLGFLVTDVVEPEVDYTVEEMRRYIYGAQDGKKVKKAAALWTSAGISTIGSGLGAFYGPIAPATYILVLGTTRQKPNERLVSHPEYIQDEAYLAGYSKAARKRKIIAAAEGGLIGLAIGIPIYWAAFRGF